MAEEKSTEAGADLGQLNSDYEAPRIQRVLTPGELEREVLYAGNVVSR